MFRWLRDVVNQVIGEAGGKMLRDMLSGQAGAFGTIAMERIRSYVQLNPRADLLYVLLSLDPSDSEKLWRRHREALKNHTENRLVIALGQALPRKRDGTQDEERASPTLSIIAQMDEEQFHQIIEELTHDPIAQKIRYFLHQGLGVLKATLSTVIDFIAVVHEFDDVIEARARELRLTLHERGGARCKYRRGWRAWLPAPFNYYRIRRNE